MASSPKGIPRNSRPARTAAPSRSLSAIRSAVAWLFPAVAILGSCGWLGLIEPTETRYAEIAREMLASGDWLIPRLNGIEHFAKPPLAYWSAAAGMALLGVNEWGARLGAALAAGFILWCTARMARLAGGALAPILLASCVLFFAFSHQLGSDIFLAASVAGFYVAVLDPRSRASLWPFVALGVGFMAKGPVVLVWTVLPVLLAATWMRDRAAARWLASWQGWLVFAVLGLPWYVVVVSQTPGLLPYLLQHQLWERYTTTVHQRVGPIYYFLVVVAVGALPWTWAMLRGLWGGIDGAARQRNLPDAILVCWIALPLVFFSFAGSKLPGYVLPMFPALAILASTWPSEARRGLWLRAGAVVFVVLLALLAVATGFDSRLGSPRAMVHKLKETRREGEPIVEYGVFNAGVPFYLREIVPLLEVPRDIGFGYSEEKDADAKAGARARVILTRGDFIRMVQSRGSVWVVGNDVATKALATALGFKATPTAGFGNQSLFLFERVR